MSAFRPQPKGFATKAIHVGQEPEQWSHQAVIPPLVMSTIFKQPAPAQPIVSSSIYTKSKFDRVEIQGKKSKTNIKDSNQSFGFFVEQKSFSVFFFEAPKCAFRHFLSAFHDVWLRL